MKFEWDETKNALYTRKPGIAFEDAALIFEDPMRVEMYDIGHSWNEDRWIGISLANPHLLFVVYAIKERDTYRIISARKANAREKREYGGL